MAGEEKEGNRGAKERSEAPRAVVAPQEIPGFRILAKIQPEAEEGVLRPVVGGLPVSNLRTGERIDPSTAEQTSQTPEKPNEQTKGK